MKGCGTKEKIATKTTSQAVSFFDRRGLAVREREITETVDIPYYSGKKVQNEASIITGKGYNSCYTR